MVGKKTSKLKSQTIGRFLIYVGMLILINIIGDSWYKRIDLTKEGRYTLSNATEELLDKLEEEVHVTMHLAGDLPLDYDRLKNATRDMLNEFRFSSGGLIDFEFMDPLANKDIEEKREILKQLSQKGLPVTSPEVKPDEVASERYIIPGGFLVYKGEEYPINVLKREFGQPLEEEINGSIELLEYEIGNVIRKCVAGTKYRLGFLEGHGELDQNQVADISRELSSFYDVKRININLRDTAALRPFAERLFRVKREDLESEKIKLFMQMINSFDALIMAKPRFRFTELENYLLDQYIMNGGKVVWMVESLIAEMDSVRKYGNIFTANYDLNLDKLMFNYGARVNGNLIQDLQSHAIPVLDQRTNRPNIAPWIFYPLFNPPDDNPITRNLESVWGRFCSSLDTTARKDLKKTILLISSEMSRVANNPVRIGINQAILRPDPNSFKKPNQVVSVLVEGSFRSAYRNRARYRETLDIPYKEKIEKNAMIFIADGDLIRNQISKGKGMIYPLGYDHYVSDYTNDYVEFANKKFFLNCVDYLVDESNLIEVRSKEIINRVLNKSKVKEQRTKWQIINLVLPIILIGLFGFVNSWWRQKKWASAPKS